MKTLVASLHVARMAFFVIVIELAVSACALGEEIPQSILSQWKVVGDQANLNWMAKDKTLQIEQSVPRVIVYGPSNIYELPYRVSFHSTVADANVLLILGGDCNPTWISPKILEENKSRNPQVYVINRAGMIVGSRRLLKN